MSDGRVMELLDERDDLRAEVTRLTAERDAALAEVALWRGDETVALLGAAAAGKLPRCDDCGTRLATVQWSDTSERMCDSCNADDGGGEEFGEGECVDLPYAARLRAAIGGAK